MIDNEFGNRRDRRHSRGTEMLLQCYLDFDIIMSAADVYIRLAADLMCLFYISRPVRIFLEDIQDLVAAKTQIFYYYCCA